MYNLETDPLRGIINPAIEGKEVRITGEDLAKLGVTNRKEAETLRQKLSNKFKYIEKEYIRVGESFKRPIPHIEIVEGNITIVVNIYDKRVKYRYEK